jgi:hypothetical protein
MINGKNDLMQNVRFIAALMLLSGVVALGQPKLVIEGGKKFDLGDLYTSKPASHVVTLRNAGTDTLVITDVSATCGCTGTMMSNDHIPPGGTGALSISFDPRKFSGKVEKALSFRTNDPDAARNHLSFTANILKVLTVEPDYLVFPRIFADSSSTQEIVIDNDTDGPVHIRSITVTPENLSVEASDMEIESGNDIKLTCTFKGAKPGTYKGTIEIRTDHPMVPILDVRFFALVTKDPPPVHQ